MVNAEAIIKEVRRVVRGINKKKTRKFVKELVEAKSVSVIGKGRSGYVAKSFAMRLKHLGVRRGNGLLVVISGSGKTRETLSRLKGFKGEVTCLTMESKSPIAKKADLVIEIKARRSNQPLRSLFEQACLVYLDSVIMILMKKMHVSEKQMWKRHD